MKNTRRPACPRATPNTLNLLFNMATYQCSGMIMGIKGTFQNYLVKPSMPTSWGYEKPERERENWNKPSNQQQLCSTLFSISQLGVCLSRRIVFVENVRFLQIASVASVDLICYFSLLVVCKCLLDREGRHGSQEIEPQIDVTNSQLRLWGACVSLWFWWNSKRAREVVLAKMPTIPKCGNSKLNVFCG